MPITKEELFNAIKNEFPDGDINITDLAGDNDHWEVEIKSSRFINKNRIMQHKLVQQAVKDYDIHALSIKTKEL